MTDKSWKTLFSWIPSVTAPIPKRPPRPKLRCLQPKEEPKAPWQLIQSGGVFMKWQHPTGALIMFAADGWHYKETGLPWYSGIESCEVARRKALKY